MNSLPEAPCLGYVALVSYIPDPLGSFLQTLRESLPGRDRSPAHITLLPPRRLTVPLETASSLIGTIVRQRPPFAVELSKVRLFPETNFLYLDLTEGDSLIHHLHTALNQSDLADREEFEFRPHLTLGGPISPAYLASVQSQAELAWSSVPCLPRFTVQEVVLLWLSPDSPQGAWRRLSTYRLTPIATRAAAASAALMDRRLLTDDNGQ
jgi:2'-5' RNA ligase